MGEDIKIQLSHEHSEYDWFDLASLSEVQKLRVQDCLAFNGKVMSRAFQEKNMAIPFDQLTDAELVDIANHMMDSLMQASIEKDYDKHIQYFSQRA